MGNVNLEKYNGWKNYETWNVALWIMNDQDFYHTALKFKNCKKPYREFYRQVKTFGTALRFPLQNTPDNISWNYPELDFDALNELVRSL